MKKTPCADGCGRKVNKMNAWRVDDEDSGENIQICCSCYYTRLRKNLSAEKVSEES